MMTMTEAHDFLNKNVAKGAKCPCCEQLVKLYKRKLNCIMALGLIRLYHLNNQAPGFYHISRLKTPIVCGGDFAKLKFWKLIEEEKNTSSNKRTSGLWQITSKGILFAENKTTAPSHLSFFNGKVCEQSEERITIIDALNIHFNYQVLMSQ